MRWKDGSVVNENRGSSKDEGRGEAEVIVASSKLLGWSMVGTYVGLPPVDVC